MLEATSSYGPIKKRQEYRVLNEGCDWYLISVKGKAIYIPRYVFEDKDGI